MSKTEVNIQDEGKNVQTEINDLESNHEKEIKNVTIKLDSSECPQPSSSLMTDSKIEVIKAAELLKINVCNDQIDISQGHTSGYNFLHECCIDIAPVLNVEDIPNISDSSIIDEVELIDSTSNNRICTRSENVPTVPASSREIPRVHFPNNATNKSLHNIELPPSYSKSLLDRKMITCASIQFIAPIPPPSYDGMDNNLRCIRRPGITLVPENTWQTQSQAAYCPVCETVTITQIEVRVSRTAHIMACVLFLLLCWPFCFLPYFFNTCNYTMHYCSVCRTRLGYRSPLQRT